MSYVEAYVEVLHAQGLHCGEIIHKPEYDAVEFGMKGENTDVKVISFFEDHIVSNRVWGIAKVPENKLADALFLCNQFNDQYKFMKFVIDDDYEITLQTDAIVDGDTAGKEAFSLVVQMIGIVDETYGKFMKLIWA